MADYAEILDLMEQYKREHPEYVKALEVIEQARRAMDAYERATRPQYRIVTTDRTNGYAACTTNPAWIGNVAESD